MSGTPARWEALNDRQNSLLMGQRKDIEDVESVILTSAQSLLGPETVNSYSGLVNPQTLSVFRDQDRWKKLTRGSSSNSTPLNNELLKTSTSWTGIRSQLDAEEYCELSEKVSQSKSKTPTASRLEYKEMKTYGGMPMQDDIVVVTCNNCDKPIIPSAYKEHRAKCKASQAEASDDPLVIRTDLLDKKLDMPKTKKRKESTTMEEPETPSSTVEPSPPPTPEKKPQEKKQKVVKAPKVKPPGRVKGPLDLDKQCGVVAIPGGTPCARSLTCKSHSMSSKRAVEGRTRPYDVLLGMYQKKPVPVKDEKAIRDSEIPLAEKEDVNVDSDEEFNDLLDAVKSYEPQPLATRSTTYIRRRNNCHRIRDLLYDALKGPCRPIIPGSSTHEQSSMHM
ncbi:hypothetical protein BGZ49_006215 [Haplosporangium sp. Z 27]|nr:hypothetical protein BGZ49_006215 [Haplosporangium sp. Z 27]